MSMMTDDIERRARHLAPLLAVTALAIALVALAGYVFDLPLLVHVAPHLHGMSVLTALSIGAVACSAIAAARGHGRVASAGITVAMVIVAAVLVGHLVAGTDRVSPFVAGLLFGTASDLAGRMSSGTALTLLLVSAALATRRHARLSDGLAGLALLITGAALLGYLYGVDDLYALPIFNTMALNTALGLMLLSAAALLVEPQRGWSAVLLSSHFGGRVTRRQLALLLLPTAIGFALREGTLSHQLGTGTALALLVIVTIAPMALLVLRDGRTQIALEIERRRHAASQVSHAKDLERRLAQKAAELEHESAERSKVEAAMYRTQRVEAIGQLSGGIAHDFNNLLAAIGGNLELMMRRLPEEHVARRYAVTAAAAVGKGAKLAGQLLAFSRSQRLAIQAIEISPALLRARELITSALGPSIALSVEFPHDGLWARTDPDQFELALLNLSLNARDAMPVGGRLHVECSARQLRLGTSTTEQAYVSIRVVDEGVGMTPEVLAKAVEPFFTTRERGKGSGLGLAQVYGFARQCEGDLVIESVPGRGTTVELLLPRTAPVDATSQKRPTPAPGSHVAGGLRKLLVVDDDDAVRAVIVELLSDAGYDIAEASDGRRALEQVDAMTPDAAVIDFLMPGINGAEVARRLQQRLPGLPVVFVSGYSDTVALDGIAGAFVLRKPFRGEQLREAVASALAGHLEAPAP